MDFTHNHYSETRKILHACVDEMYAMERGVFIANPDEKVHFLDACFSRKNMKHIVEQRKADGKSAQEIKEMMDAAFLTIIQFDFKISNPNKKYPGSILRMKILDESRGIIVVLDREAGNGRSVITVYPCRPDYIQLLLLRK